MPNRHKILFHGGIRDSPRCVELLPFDADLRYSEDVDWTARIQALGWLRERFERLRHKLGLG